MVTIQAAAGSPPPLDAGGRSTLHHRSPPHIPLLQRLPFGEEEPDEGEAEDVMGSLLTEYLGSPQQHIAASESNSEVNAGGKKRGYS
ncbi:hypothetical protein ZWY2020_044257 [Hordeum vulgare]|nr:hypothetical protein ZWY2020_044257 [Hordeum vulgare]